MPRLPKLLVVNPNTSDEVGALIDAFGRSIVGSGAVLSTVSASFGFPYLATRVSTAIGAHAALDAAARAMAVAGPPDAVVLACFGDPGRDALQELVGRPVAGFAEAGLLAAAELSGRFIIAVNGTSWCEMLGELTRSLGISDRVAAIVTIENCDPTPAAIAAFVSAETRRHGAHRAVVGGAGLIGVLPAIAAAAQVPILDPHREAFLKAMRLAQVDHQKASRGPAPPDMASGLSPALSRLIGGSRERREAQSL